METLKTSAGMRILGAVCAIIMILGGFWLLATPRYIVWVFSAAVLIYGVQLIVKYFSMKDKRSGWDIIAGIVNVLFGLFMLFGGPGAIVAGVMTMEFIAAFWAIFAGFSHIFSSFGLKKEGAKKWVWTLAGGILLVICGIAFLIWPVLSAIGLVFTLGVFAGVSFIISGFTSLAIALSGKSAAGKAKAAGKPD